MTRRYFVPELTMSGGVVRLDEDEARHAARVMRVQVGESITLFDGRGHECEAIVSSIDKRHCIVESAVPVAVDREPTRKVQLAIALPKPDRAKELIERLTEQGVQRVTPIVCQRTQRPPSESLLTKLRRCVIESSKQCGRNVLMMIDDPVAFGEAVDLSGGEWRWLAHPDGESPKADGGLAADSGSASVLIGPEGGFTEEEVACAVDAGFRKVGLGKRIYRIETAAVVAVSWLIDD